MRDTESRLAILVGIAMSCVLSPKWEGAGCFAFAGKSHSLQGTSWIIAKKVVNGDDVPKGEFNTIRVFFSINQMRIRDVAETAIGIEDERLPIVINEQKKPNQIDVMFGGDEKAYGIFETDGVSLKICFAPKRPEAFASTPENKATLIELTRKQD